MIILQMRCQDRLIEYLLVERPCRHDVWVSFACECCYRPDIPEADGLDVTLWK